MKISHEELNGPSTYLNQKKEDHNMNRISRYIAGFLIGAALWMPSASAEEYKPLGEGRPTQYIEGNFIPAPRRMPVDPFDDIAVELGDYLKKGRKDGNPPERKIKAVLNESMYETGGYSYSPPEGNPEPCPPLPKPNPGPFPDPNPIPCDKYVNLVFQNSLDTGAVYIGRLDEGISTGKYAGNDIACGIPWEPHIPIPEPPPIPRPPSTAHIGANPMSGVSIGFDSKCWPEPENPFPITNSQYLLESFRGSLGLNDINRVIIGLGRHSTLESYIRDFGNIKLENQQTPGSKISQVPVATEKPAWAIESLPSGGCGGSSKHYCQ